MLQCCRQGSICVPAHSFTFSLVHFGPPSTVHPEMRCWMPAKSKGSGSVTCAAAYAKNSLACNSAEGDPCWIACLARCVGFAQQGHDNTGGGVGGHQVMDTWRCMFDSGGDCLDAPSRSVHICNLYVRPGQRYFIAATYSELLQAISFVRVATSGGGACTQPM